MKVLRLIIYDGDLAWLAEQLGRSMPDGEHPVSGGNKISIVTLGSLPLDPTTQNLIEEISNNCEDKS